MSHKFVFVLFALLLASCSGKDDDKPCVGCTDPNNANNVTPDAGGGVDLSTPADMATLADSGSADMAPTDTGAGVDVGVDSGTDLGVDAGVDMGVSCNADEMLCAGVCAACPADVNVDTYVCIDAYCVIETCDVGYVVCQGGCCTPAGPAMTGGVSMQSFTALDTSIALDSREYPRISYRNFFGTNLEVAAWDGRQWMIEVVETGVDPSGTSIAVDSVDDVHVAWLEAGSFDLKYARRSMGTWQVTTVDATGDVGAYASLAIDAMDRPHIAYQDSTNGALKYARWTGSMWAIETVDAMGGNTGYFASLDFDSTGRPAIAYADFAVSAVRMARLGGGVWATTTVEMRPAIPQYISMAMDAADNAHIVYFDSPAQDLRYVRRSGAMWVGELADTTANYGHSPRLKLDSAGYPRVVYHDASTDDVRYAAFDGATWQITDLSATESIGPHSSIALDAADGVHLSLSIKTAPVQLRYVKLP